MTTNAQALGLSPSALIAVAIACYSRAAPRAVLLQAISKLETLGLVDEVPPASADALENAHPTSIRAAAIRAQVQELKSQAFKQDEAAKEL